MTQPRTGAQLGDALQTRNMPRSIDDWERLLDSDIAEAVETDTGEMALVQERNQLRLHYAFDDLETMTSAFHPMFEALRPVISDSDYPYITIDLVEHANRRWIENLLTETDFQSTGEWLELEHHDLVDFEPPEIPQGLTMRRAKTSDIDSIVEIEGAAYGDWTDGEHATRMRFKDADWSGVLENDDGVIAYAINTAIENGRGEIISCAVAPDNQGDGIGRIILSAATYQLASSDAREVTVRVRPDIPKAARSATPLGFVVGRRGVELRRHTDEEVLIQARENARIRGMKVRFGGWR
jgi:ribosomal protein S18 acetylase RimI-like enzyme